MGLHYLLLLAAPLLLVTGAPSTGFKCPVALGYFPNLEDCTKYFLCQKNMAFLDSCKAKMEWDSPTRKCVPAGQAKCAERPVTNFKCPEPLGFFPHDDCEKFYQCQNNLAYLDKCPTGQSFDVVTSNCIRTRDAACLDKRDPSFKCPAAQGIFPDPHFCERFYKCFDYVGYVLTCQTGQRFNAPTKQCLAEGTILCESTRDTLFHCLRPQGLFPYFQDCTKYYNCQNNLAYLQACPAGQMFDVPTSNCTRGQALCEKQIDQTFRCPAALGTFSHKTDCSRYYQCHNNIGFVLDCAPGLWFDEPTQKCVGQSDAHCGHTIDGAFKCPAAQGYFPHETVCEKYYKCVDFKGFVLQCGVGMRFDAPKKLCVVQDAALCEKDRVIGFTCPAAQGNFADKKDCTQYVICQDRVGFTKVCGAGLSFDEPSNRCVGTSQARCGGDRDDSFRCPAAQGIFPHPSDCSKHYVCQNYVGYLQYCGANLLFDAPTKTCRPRLTALCENSIDRLFKCPAAQGIFPHQKFCSQYYQCVDYVGYILLCGTGLHFDAPTSTCVSRDNARCQDRIDPSFRCPAAQGSFPHSLECSKYFLCHDFVGFTLVCGEGMAYDAPSKTCVVRNRALCESTKDPTFTCPAAQGTFAHPKICSHYYECRNYVGFLLICGTGLLFDMPNKQCVPKSGARCEGSITPTFKCPAALGSFSDKKDCTRYYQCHDQVGFVQTCGEGLAFDEPLGKCVGALDARCGGNATVFQCPAAQGFYPHETVCSQYYSCYNNIGFVLTCGDGLFFDIVNERCVSRNDARCEKRLCPAAQGDFSDKKDCKQYITCKDNVGFMKVCGEGLLFDFQKGLCLGRGEAICDPDAPFVCPKPNGLYPRFECYGYWRCLNWLAYEESCPDGLHFHIGQEKCLDKHLVECGNRIYPTEEICDSCEIDGPIECPEWEGTFPHPWTRKKFLVCEENFPQIMDCPANLNFDPVEKVCVWS